MLLIRKKFLIFLKSQVIIILLFEGNKNLIRADFSNLRTDNIKSMKNLFKYCSNLVEVIFNAKKHQI